MAQNVTIAGNQYPDVPSILVPKTGGGGNAIFADPSVVTAVAADVASGKYFLDSSGVLTQGTASGGGGASNIVTGTFTGTTTGAAMDVTLNYSGSGYPIAVAVYPKDGYQSGSDIYSLLQKNVIVFFTAVKRTAETPTWTSSGMSGVFVGTSAYKSSTSNSASISVSGSASISVITGGNATSGANAILKFKAKDKMSVYIADTSYGFAVDTEYTYQIIYSS